MKRLHTQAHPIAPRGTGSTQAKPWTLPNRCTVNTPKAGTASRYNRLKPYRWANQCSRLAQRRGGENRKRGAGGGCGCQTAVPARFRVSPPDSGVVPFSEKPLPPIKSDVSFSGRVGLPPENIVMFSSSPVTTWGRSGILRDRAYGIS